MTVSQVRSDPIGGTLDGYLIFDNPKTIEDSLKDLISKAIPRLIIGTNVNHFETTIRFRQPVGQCVVVPTKAGDYTFLALKQGKKNPSRFVHGKVPFETNELSIVLRKKKGEQGYIIATAYLGPLRGPERYNHHTTLQSVRFWETHAYTWGYVTAICCNPECHRPLKGDPILTDLSTRFKFDIALCQHCQSRLASSVPYTIKSLPVVGVGHDFLTYPFVMP